MKKIFFLLFLGIGPLAFAKPGAYFTLEKTHYNISTYFEMKSPKNEGKVIRSYLNIRTIYDLYNPQGSYIAQGIAKALSNPSHPLAKIIEISDANRKRIGFIDGETRMGSKIVKYNFYNDQNQLLAVTYYEKADESFSLLGYSHEPKILGVVKRKSKGSNIWEIAMQDTTTIPPELLKVFAAFVADHF